MKLEINPHVGIGAIRFGMTRDEVNKILGEPDETELFSLEEEDEELTETWHYDELEISMSFEEDLDFRLTTIATSSDDCLLLNKNVVGMSEGELKSFLESQNFGTIEEEDIEEDSDDEDGFFDFTTLKVEDKDIYFWFDNGVLSEVQFGARFTEDGIPVW
jgi:hypothetical protein